jgi:DNA-binding MarR family transcriptional regulator
MASGGPGGRAKAPDGAGSGTDASPEHQVITGLAKVGLAMKSSAWRAAGPRRLTPTQAQILSLLRERASPLRLAAIALGLGVTAPTASDAVAALVEKRLVTKGRDRQDARVLAVRLTAAGRRLAIETAAWPETLMAAVGDLPPAEQAAFLRALVKVIRTLHLRGEIPEARMCVTCRYFRPGVHADPACPHHCDFTDAPFGDRALQLECGDHETATAAAQDQAWRTFVGA